MKEIFKIDDIETISCDIDEQETIINIQRDQASVKIYTSDNTMVTKLSKLFEKSEDHWRCFEQGREKNGKVTGYVFITDKKAISFRTGKKRIVSEENRKKAAERMKKYKKMKGVLES